MPQNNQFLPFKNIATAKPTLANTDTLGNSVVVNGVSSALNITAATVVKTGAGRIATVCVNTAGSTVGGVYDVATTGAAAAANLVFALPNTVGVYRVEFPLSVGLVVTPGTGQVVSISYN